MKCKVVKKTIPNEWMLKKLPARGFFFPFNMCAAIPQSCLAAHIRTTVSLLLDQIIPGPFFLDPSVTRFQILVLKCCTSLSCLLPHNQIFSPPFLHSSHPPPGCLSCFFCLCHFNSLPPTLPSMHASLGLEDVSGLVISVHNAGWSRVASSPEASLFQARARAAKCMSAPGCILKV